MKTIIENKNLSIFCDDLDKSTSIPLQHKIVILLNSNIHILQLNNIRNQLEITLIKRK